MVSIAPGKDLLLAENHLPEPMINQFTDAYMRQHPPLDNRHIVPKCSKSLSFNTKIYFCTIIVSYHWPARYPKLQSFGVNLHSVGSWHLSNGVFPNTLPGLIMDHLRSPAGILKNIMFGYRIRMQISTATLIWRIIFRIYPNKDLVIRVCELDHY